MDDLINMMVSNESPSDISDKIKDLLMQKAAQNIEVIRPIVAASIVNGEPPEEEIEVETSDDSYEDESEDYEEDAE